MYMSAPAPEAPPFSETTIGCFMRLFFWIAACIMRAIWSEAPPAPAATTISTGLVGSQANAGAEARLAAINVMTVEAARLDCMGSPPRDFERILVNPDQRARPVGIHGGAWMYEY